MRIVPMTITGAKEFVAKHHRHNKPDLSALFAAGLVNGDDEIIGVAVAGRPKARALQDGFTIEVTRVCTLGHRNANSMLYAAILRAAKALGYHRAYTYTLAEESGASLRAAGFTEDARLAARETWSCPSRLRTQRDMFGVEQRPPGPKIRWKKEIVTVQP